MTTDTDSLTVRKKLKKRIKLRTREGESNGPRAIRLDHHVQAPKHPDVPLKVVQVAPATVTLLPKERTKRFWVGVTQDSPFDNRAFGGVAFQRYSGEVFADPVTGELNLTRANPGNTVDLTEEQVNLVCRAVAARVCRTVGDKTDATGNYRCDTLSVTSPGFRPTEGDRPVGRFLYMVEIHEQMPYEWRKSSPPTMVARN